MSRFLFILVLIAATAPNASRAQSPEQIAKGAQVWAQNCTRCHNARSSLERNDRDWATIVLHMRARANLTRSEGDAVAAFLQATNAPEPGIAPPAPPAVSAQQQRNPDTRPGAGSVSQDTVRSSSRALSEAEVRAVTHFVWALH